MEHRKNCSLVFAITAIFCTNGVSSITCSSSTDSCRCDTDEGMVDLSSLDSGDSTNPSLSATSGDFLYTYNPCTQFTIGGGSGCSNVLACQENPSANTYFPLGDSSTAQWTDDGSGNLQITMNSYDGQTTRYLTVQLVCDQNVESGFQATENGAGTADYTYTLTSKCCCPNGCTGSTTTHPPPPTGGGGGGSSSGLAISVGTLLLILLLVFGIIYFVGGVLFMHFAKGASGSEMIPNVTFWKAVPGLVKDGTLFVAHSATGRRSYEQKL